MNDFFITAVAVTVVVAFIGVSLVLEGDNLFAKSLGFLLVAATGALLYTSAVIEFGPDRIAVDPVKCEAYAWQEVEREWKCFDGSEP